MLAGSERLGRWQVEAVRRAVSTSVLLYALLMGISQSDAGLKRLLAAWILKELNG